MKRLSLIFALLWWAQGAVCLLPGLSHAHGAAGVPAAAEHVDHGAHAHHGESGHDGANAPLPDGDSGSDQHCASLTQALAPTAPAQPGAVALWLPLRPPETLVAIQRVAARSLDSHHGPPPPNLIIAHASLLI